MNKNKSDAILLIGPTGSGKTPLGNLLACCGFQGKTCFHFDFGNALRKAAAREEFCDLLSESDIVFLENVLQEGALLENETFYIADHILRAFISGHQMTGEDNLVLNGLPRHMDQARDAGKIVDIQMIIYLKCTPEVVRERIRLNTGGDRNHRKDDSLEDIAAKLSVFEGRTIPMIDYFKNKNIKIVPVNVAVNTTPEMILKKIQSDGNF